MNLEAVRHGVEQMNARIIEAHDLRLNGNGAGSQNETVVRHRLRNAFVADQNMFLRWIDKFGSVIGKYFNPRKLRSMREAPPVGRLTAEVERQTTDAVIGERSASSTVISAAESISRARKAALMPASLPPTMTNFIVLPVLALPFRRGERQHP